MHGVPDLELNKTISNFALEWSKYLCETQKWEHRQGHRYGENLGRSNRSKYICAIAVEQWYVEIKLYDFAAAQYVDGAGHFTQLIWKASKQVGCGYQELKGKNFKYITCNYNPPGNVNTQYKENVLPKV